MSQSNAIVSRDTLKSYCLRRLGSPTISVNVSDDQIEDRIDDAFQYYRDYLCRFLCRSPKY